MDPRERLEALRAKHKPEQVVEDDYAKLARLRAKYKPEEQPSFADQAAEAAWSGVLKPVGSLINAADTYVGAPMRAGLQATIDERNREMAAGRVSPVFSLEPIQAAYNQFGEDPAKAPSWDKLAEQYGFSAEKDKDFLTLNKPFYSQNAKFVPTKISNAEIAGAVMGTAVDPFNWKISKPLAGMLTKAAAEGGSVLKRRVIKPLARTAAHVGMSVKPADFDYYVANQPRLKGQYTQGTGPIVRDIISDTQGVKSNAAISAQAVDTATEGLATKADDLKNRMSPKNLIDDSHVEPWQEMLEEDKKWQGAQSDKADEILASYPITAPKKTLLKRLDDLIKEYPPITQGNQATQNSLQFIRDGLDQHYSAYLNGPQFRKWMRTVRKEIQFKRGAGEYTGDLDQALQSVTEFVSDSLKDTAPKYGEIMTGMSTRAKASDKMAEQFGDQTKGMRFLRKTQDTDPGVRNIANKDLSEYAEVTEEPRFKQTLENYEALRKKRENLDQIGYEQAFPAEQNQIKELGGRALTDQYRANELGDFNEKSTHRIVKDTGMFHGGNPQNQKAVESLNKNFPEENYPQRIRDEGVLHGFSVERPMGSRATLMGTVLGGWIGGQLGMTAGALGGATVDKMGGTIARGMIDTAMGTERLAKSIATKFANPSPKIMPYLKVFDKAAEAGTKGVLLYHHLLWNNDPEYRKAFEEP
jgi:hypothetical protein